MTWDKNNYSNADILFLCFESVQPHQKMTMTVLGIAVLWQSLLLLQRTSISALIFQADEAFNRENESSLGMVAMGNNSKLANELFNF